MYGVNTKVVKPANNTVAMPVDSGEHQFYHKSSGKFYPLAWNNDPKPDIVLSPEEMVIARKAFRERWPEWKHIAESYYDLETDTFHN